MKAKEYAQRVTSTENVQDAMTELGKCGKDFFNEFIAMRKSRNIKTDDGLLTLVKEFDNKFRTFSVLVDSHYKGMVKPNGFIELLREFVPVLANEYERKNGR